MQYSSDEISIEEECLNKKHSSTKNLKYISHWPPVNIEFQDLVYTVPDVSGNKVILRGVSGKFRSSQLTAILGPSGAGKSTLLNVLAGYKVTDATGSVLVNGKQRDIRTFRKMSRYIMQEDLYQPMLTIREAMMVSADLKLGSDLSKDAKNEIIDEILELLRLNKAGDTMGHRLSGGERKRLSIALELVNNPPVVFLDEPTTGLDDLSCSQCVSLLQRVAHAGRTVISSIHTPSAKIFEMIDHVYILSGGQCVYQGRGADIVNYMYNIGLNCPLTYNPADFIIDVASGEYGHEFVDKMVSLVDNGRCYNWMPVDSIEHKNNLNNEKMLENMVEFEEEINPKCLKQRSSFWQQFCILYRRRTTQMWRDSSYVKLRIYMTFFLGVVVGGIYQGIGNDASKALFNFGFCFTVTIAFMYCPLMPVLLQFPSEVQLLKREHFNRWYRIGPFYLAMMIAKLPMQIALAFFYITMIYLLSDQPIDLHRMAMFYTISLLIALTSESFGVLIASRLSLVNGMFIGPVCTVPLMLLSVFGMGYGREVEVPSYIRLVMSFSYLRYGLEGLIDAMYGHNRADTICPDNEVYCMFANAKFLKMVLGFEDVSFMVSFIALIMYYLLFTVTAYYMIKIRVATTSSNIMAVQYLGRFVKTHLNFAAYKY